MSELTYRSVRHRLAVGFVCDAERGGFPKVEPGSTLERIFLTEGGTHPYSLMWKQISNYYENRNWSELCDESLESELNNMATQGFQSSNGNFFITPEEMNKAAQRWRNYGWYDYEMKKAKKTRSLKKWGTKGLIITTLGGMFGLPSIGE